MHMRALAKSECAKDAGELTVVRLGFVVSLMEEVREERDTYWKERVQAVRRDLKARMAHEDYTECVTCKETLYHLDAVIEKFTNEDNLK